MTFIRLMHALSNCVFWPAFGLSITRLIKLKTYAKWACIAFTFDAVAYGADGRWISSTLHWIIAAYLYRLWKKSPDDDDRPKKKRAALRSKFDKFLPKPVDTPVRSPA